jgi:hypothetical protein
MTTTTALYLADKADVTLSALERICCTGIGAIIAGAALLQASGIVDFFA